MKKTGIMGGSFNPIHNGHLQIAKSAFEQYALDEVLFIPAYCAPHKEKSVMIAPKDRLAMVELAIKNVPHYTMSDMEIKQGGYSFTYLTITKLRQLEPDTEWFFLMGADSLTDFKKWRNTQIIASNCHILAAMRDDMDDADVKRLAKELSEEYHSDFDLVQIPPTDISSTEIRNRIKEGISIEQMVPKDVLDYIKEHHLYED